jgi:hypothetical protein
VRAEESIRLLSRHPMRTHVDRLSSAVTPAEKARFGRWANIHSGAVLRAFTAQAKPDHDEVCLFSGRTIPAGTTAYLTLCQTVSKQQLPTAVKDTTMWFSRPEGNEELYLRQFRLWYQFVHRPSYIKAAVLAWVTAHPVDSFGALARALLDPHDPAAFLWLTDTTIGLLVSGAAALRHIMPIPAAPTPAAAARKKA